MPAQALVNATVVPMGPPAQGIPPWGLRAEAVLWKDGAILAVGDEAAVLREARRLGARVDDAGGRLVLPGFVDAHMHLIHAGMRLLRPDLRGATGLGDALDGLAAWLRANPGSEPVTGEGWDESGWPERRWPTRADLDAACQSVGQEGRPVVLRRIDGHIAVANSAALRIVRRRWDDGGLVDMETGVLLEDASLYLNEALPASPATIDAALSEACRIAHGLGVTTVGDYSQAPFRAAIRRAAAAGRLGIRIASSIYVPAFEEELARGFRTGRPGPAPTLQAAHGGVESLRDGGLKLFLDGSLGAHTAALRGHYHDDRGKGRLNWSDPQVRQLVLRAHAAGIQVHAHAIGDAAIDQALDAFEAALGGVTGEEGSPPDAKGLGRTPPPLRRGEGHGKAGSSPQRDDLNPLRHRIEHCELAHDDQLARMARLGIVSSSQPNFVGEWSGKGGMYEARLGETFRLNNRFRTMLSSGVPLAFGSDGMPFGPLVGLQAAVDHPVPSERLAPLEAAWHYTWMAAWSLHWEDAVGSLAPGKRADLVVMDGNPEGPPKEWVVRTTIIDGHVVHPVKE